jgi:transcriptional regulator GlxA family with amidase domain
MTLRAAALAVALLAAGCGEAVAPENSAVAPPWTRVAAPQDLPVDRPLRAGFLVLDGVYNTELTAPYDILHHTPFHTEPAPGIEVFTVSPDGRPVTTFEGLRLTPDHSFADAPEIDILVVPSAERNMGADLENEALIAWVRETGSRARYVLSLCDGAFILAAAGLLDGHRCTTFPGDQDRFAEMFPALDLRRGPSFVHDGRVLTSQGGARSFDVSMYLVDHLYGERVARGVGRGMVIDWPPRPGALNALVVAD